MKYIFLLSFTLLSFFSAVAQDGTKTELREYLVVRVQYGNTLAGYKYELYLDIGVSGSHSMSGQVTNVDERVFITTDEGKLEFKSDMDLVNYLAKEGWVVMEIGAIDILDQHYTTYTMERRYYK